MPSRGNPEAPRNGPARVVIARPVLRARLNAAEPLDIEPNDDSVVIFAAPDAAEVSAGVQGMGE